MLKQCDGRIYNPKVRFDKKQLGPPMRTVPTLRHLSNGGAIIVNRCANRRDWKGKAGFFDSPSDPKTEVEAEKFRALTPFPSFVYWHLCRL